MADPKVPAQLDSTGAPSSVLMPVVFIGHGSPLHALAQNPFTRALSALPHSLPQPKAILCISAHWMTKGETCVTSMERPRTIHDFFGFPEALFAVQYPAPGDPALAELLVASVPYPRIKPDALRWGLDHGAWSVLVHMFPRADIPVVQLSLDLSQPAPFHFDLGVKLRFLREQGVLILGSGNVVHNLGAIDWDENAPPHPWALACDAWVRGRLMERDFEALVRDYATTDAGRWSVPTPDHYFPFLYCLGAALPQDTPTFVFEGIQNASISMRSFVLSH